ncbi:proline-rich protein 2-like [Cynocephalus volans]|uniref:proline-rich protein 2-like n=1 Tax=Cynocephalus volans TaxID=110931 RepID=UPI002FCB8A0A
MAPNARSWPGTGPAVQPPPGRQSPDTARSSRAQSQRGRGLPRPPAGRSCPPPRRPPTSRERGTGPTGGAGGCPAGRQAAPPGGGTEHPPRRAQGPPPARRGFPRPRWRPPDRPRPQTERWRPAGRRGEGAGTEETERGRTTRGATGTAPGRSRRCALICWRRRPRRPAATQRHPTSPLPDSAAGGGAAGRAGRARPGCGARVSSRPGGPEPGARSAEATPPPGFAVLGPEGAVVAARDPGPGVALFGNPDQGASRLLASSNPFLTRA